LLAEAPLTDALSPGPLKVKRGRIEKDQIQTAEQIPPAKKDLLFDQVFGTAIGQNKKVNRYQKSEVNNTTTALPPIASTAPAASPHAPLQIASAAPPVATLSVSSATSSVAY
jgi:hypothetical protein